MSIWPTSCPITTVGASIPTRQDNGKCDCLLLPLDIVASDDTVALDVVATSGNMPHGRVVNPRVVRGSVGGFIFFGPF